MAASRRVFPLGVKEKREKGVRAFFWGCSRWSLKTSPDARLLSRSEINSDPPGETESGSAGTQPRTRDIRADGAPMAARRLRGRSAATDHQPGSEPAGLSFAPPLPLSACSDDRSYPLPCSSTGDATAKIDGTGNVRRVSYLPISQLVTPRRKDRVRARPESPPPALGHRTPESCLENPTGKARVLLPPAPFPVRPQLRRPGRFRPGQRRRIDVNLL